MYDLIVLYYFVINWFNIPVRNQQTSIIVLIIISTDNDCNTDFSA